MKVRSSPRFPWLETVTGTISWKRVSTAKSDKNGTTGVIVCLPPPPVLLPLSRVSLSPCIPVFGTLNQSKQDPCPSERDDVINLSRNFSGEVIKHFVPRTQ